MDVVLELLISVLGSLIGSFLFLRGRDVPLIVVVLVFLAGIGVLMILWAALDLRLP